MKEERRITLLEAEEKFAKSIYNGLWDLLEKDNRTPSEDEDLLLGAYSSLYHWKKVGTEVNLQRGYWMVSRVYLALEQKEDALAWARKCLVFTEKNRGKMEDFDLAFAQEIMARAYASAGDLERTYHHFSQAVALGEKIQDQEAKKIFTNDLVSGDWFQFNPDQK